MYKYLKDSRLVDNLVRVSRFVETSKLASLELKFIKIYKLFFNKLTYFILSIITLARLLIAL